MTGDLNQFSDLKLNAKGFVTYGDNNKGRILGKGKVGAPPFTSIEDVLYVEGLKHNLLSISQLCDKGFKIKFTKEECLIIDEVTNEVKLKGTRINNIFMISLNDLSLKVKCLLVNNNESWLWHKRAAHIHMDHLNKLTKHDLVIGLPKIKFVKDKLCDACQKGKQTKSSFKPKNVVTTTRTNLGKFDEKSDEGIFLGYSLSSKAYRIYNKRTLTIEESMHVSFDETNTSKEEIVVCDDDDPLDLPPEEPSNDTIVKAPEELSNDIIEKAPEVQQENVQQESVQQESNTNDLPKEWRTHRDHPIDKVIGDISQGVATRLNLKDACLHMAFVSQIEPSKVDEALGDDQWINAMQE